MNYANEDHTRCIMHIHIDYFYIQVATKGNPALLRKPIAVVQNDTVTLVNEAAFKSGVRHLMKVEHVLDACADVLILQWSLETFRVYRQLSYSVTTFLQRYSSHVERLGLDENFVDISHIIRERLAEQCSVIGDVYSTSSSVCSCGCYERLKTATQVVHEMRTSLTHEFNLTSHAGIAHNKLIAHLSCELCHCGQQIVTFPPTGRDLVLRKSIHELPAFSKLLGDNLSVKSIRDLRDQSILHTLPTDKASLLYELSLGIDNSPVKGRFLNLDDNHRATDVEAEIRHVLAQLLKRLLALAIKDGRVPRRIELLVRKTDGHAKVAHKIVKSMNLSGKLFMQDAKLHIADDDVERQLLMQTCKLFLKAVDVRRPFHVTLLGLSFRRFRESLRSLYPLMLKDKMEVQMVTNIESKFEHSHSMSMMDIATTHSDNTDGSESEVEPSPKKKKRMTTTSFMRTGGRCCPSPSKLNVAQLRINNNEST